MMFIGLMKMTAGSSRNPDLKVFNDTVSERICRRNFCKTHLCEIFHISEKEQGKNSGTVDESSGSSTSTEKVKGMAYVKCFTVCHL